MSTLIETPPAPKEQPRLRLRHRWSYAVAALTLLALVLRLVWLGRNAPWLDEAFSYTFSRELANSMDDPSHPPGYYVVLMLWNEVSIDLWWGRFLSVLLGTAAVPVVALTGRRLGGSVTGLLAGVLFALSPLQIQHSQEVRMYTFVILCAAVMIWALTHALLDSTKLSIGFLAAYVATSSLALWVHGGGVLLFGTVNLVAVMHWGPQWFRTRTLPVQARRWMTATVLAIVTWLPFLPIYLLRLLRGEQVIEAQWRGIGELWRSQWWLASAYAPVDTPIAVLFTVFWVMLAAAGLYTLRKTPMARALGILWLFVPAVMVVVSLSVTEIFSTKAMLWSAIPFYLACAVAGARLHASLRTYHDHSNVDGFLLVVVFSLLGSGIVGYHLEGGAIEKVGDAEADRLYRQVALQLWAADLDDGDVVITSPGFLVHHLRFYWEEQFSETPMPTMIGLPFISPYDQTMLAARGHDQVFLVYGYPYYPNSDPDDDARQALIDLGGEEQALMRDQRFANVYLYDMPAEVRNAERLEVESDEL